MQIKWVRDESKGKMPENIDIRGFQENILNWYRYNGRNFPWRARSTSNYQKIVSEILLQRTKAETVSSFFPIFILRFPSWKSLASVTESEIGLFIKPIGLWQRRAKSLSMLSKEMARRNSRFPKDRQEIEALPGVGQYIANAIQLFCHGKSMPLLDVNMARLLERYFGPRQLSDIRYDPYLQQLSLKVVDCNMPQKLNWAIIDLSAVVCSAKAPKHDICPLKQDCLFVK